MKIHTIAWSYPIRSNGDDGEKAFFDDDDDDDKAFLEDDAPMPTK